MQKVPHCKQCSYYVHGKWGGDIKYDNWCMHFDRNRKTHLLNSEVKTSPKDCPIRIRLGLSTKKTPQEKTKEIFAMPEKEKPKYNKKSDYWNKRS